MKHAVIALFGTLLLFGCAKEDAPPIQIDVVAPSVTKQLTDKYGDAYIKTGKVEYDAEKNIYNVELFYKRDGTEKRYVISMLRAYDSQRQLLQYTGEVPVELMGEASPHGRAYFPVTVDVMMNKQNPTKGLRQSRILGLATSLVREKSPETMNLEADIVPGKSAAGVDLLSRASLLLSAFAPNSTKTLKTCKVYTFGPVVVWSSPEDRITQIGLQRGYHGSTPQGIKIGDTLSDIHKRVGRPYEDDEDVLQVEGIEGLALETTEWKNYSEAGYDPEAVVTWIFIFPIEERTMPSNQ